LDELYKCKGIDLDSKLRQIRSVTYHAISNIELILIVTFNDNSSVTFTLSNDRSIMERYDPQDELMIEISKVILMEYWFTIDINYTSFISDYFVDPDYGKSIESIKDRCTTFSIIF
jgi:hypothetical protein